MVCTCKKCCDKKCDSKCDTKCDTKCDSKCNFSCAEGLKQVDSVYTGMVNNYAKMFDGSTNAYSETINIITLLQTAPLTLSNFEQGVLESFVWLQMLGLSASTSNTLLDSISNLELPPVELVTCQSAQCCVDCAAVMASFTSLNELVRKTKYDIFAKLSGPSVTNMYVSGGDNCCESILSFQGMLIEELTSDLIPFALYYMEILLSLVTFVHHYSLLFFLCDKCGIQIIYDYISKTYAQFIDLITEFEKLTGFQFPTTLFDNEPPYDFSCNTCRTHRTGSNSRLHNTIADAIDGILSNIHNNKRLAKLRRSHN